MQLVPSNGAHSVKLVGENTEQLLGRSTWTPGLLSVSRKSCRVRLADDGRAGVWLTSLRCVEPPLLCSLSSDASPRPLLPSDGPLFLPPGSRVHLCGLGDGTVSFQVSLIDDAAATRPASTPSPASRWIRVQKLPSAPSLPASPSPPSPSPPEAQTALKRLKKTTEAPASVVRHVCSGKLLSDRFTGVTLKAVNVASMRLNDQFQDQAQIDEKTSTLVLCGGDLEAFDEKVSFWARESFARGLVCGFDVFGLSESPDLESRDFRVALAWKRCALVVGSPELDNFIGEALPLRDSVAECREDDLVKNSLEFEGTEAEQTLGFLFGSQLSQQDQIRAAAQPAVVQSVMKHHQLLALAWMLNKELKQSDALPPFWEERLFYGPRPWSASNASDWGTRHFTMSLTFLIIVQRFDSGRDAWSRFPRPLISRILSLVPNNWTYFHQLTNIETLRRPKCSRGGILADDMGLGKTLSAISLICANSAVELSPGLVSARLVSTPNYGAFYDDDLVDGGDHVQVDVAKLDYWTLQGPAFVDRRPTLIVCPLSVISNWQDQIVTHLGYSCLSVHVYHGANKCKDPLFLKKQDVVLTTYGTMAMEFPEALDQRGPLSFVRWRRIFLDEAHYIRNGGRKVSKAAMRIDAAYRWALTGTPLQNRIKDLQPLFSFIHEEVFSDSGHFRKLITDPIMNSRAEGALRLRTLMMSVCLRRTKDSLDISGRPLVNIPEKHVHVVRMVQTPEEHLYYVAFDTQAKELFERLEKSGVQVLREHYQYLMVIILRLRQLCLHAAMCKDIEGFFRAAGNGSAELLAADGCCMCNESWAPHLTPCGHAFCQDHLDPIRESDQCSFCLEHVDAEKDMTLVSSQTALPTLSTTGSRKKPRLRLMADQPPSTKMNKVLELVQQLQASGKDKAKAVVFSQFTEFLDLLEDFLASNGIRTTRIDGSVSQSGRVAAMAAFYSSAAGSPTVMLASIMAAGTGINLLGASVVILTDQWWNPAVEDQAIDRVHRIGQTVQIHVYKLIVAGSIEERMLEIHAAKAAISKMALVLRSPEELKQMNLTMMRKLFGTAVHVRGRRGERERAQGLVLPRNT